MIDLKVPQRLSRSSQSPVWDLRRLRVLQAVAREGSLSGAARVLDYTQPAVAHHVRRLEVELGTPLVLRRGRGVTLTPAGRALAARADVLLAAAAAAEEEVASLAGLRGGRVRLVAFPSATATIVPPALAALRAAHPDLDVTLDEAEPPDSVDRVLRGEADVAVSFEVEGAADEFAELARVELLDVPSLAVLRRDHPLAGGGPVSLDALAGETWIAGCPRCRGHLVKLCAEEGFEPAIAYATDDYVAVQGMVAAGLGVALLPALVENLVRRDDVVMAPLARPASRTVVATALSSAATVPAVGALLGALQDAAGRTLTA
jgi:DNA-binding transcriptional LysR family regulator